MKVIIEDDEGRRMTLNTELTVIPKGYAVLICPASREHYFNDKIVEDMQEAFARVGLRVMVSRIPVMVWSIEDARP